MRAKRNYELIENESHCTVLVKRYMGKSTYYPYNEMWVRILVDKNNVGTKWEEFTYCLQRYEGDTLENWQGRERAASVVGEDALVAAEKSVEKLHKRRASNMSKGRKSWQYRKILELCERTGLPTNYKTDVTNWNSLFCKEHDPQEFLLCLRENGSHIYSEAQDSPDWRWTHAKSEGAKAKYFFLTRDATTEITPDMYASFGWKNKLN